VPLPSKISCVKVEKGDHLIYVTAGGGGWKDPLDRPPERVQKDVIRKLVSLEKARRDYGVVLDPRTLAVDDEATNELRAKIRQARGPLPTFTFGPTPEPIGIMAAG
jgi:N-methylhydantoinase B